VSIWDDGKRARNLAKHGVDFVSVDRFDWNASVELDDKRFAYPERRVVAIGPLDGRLHVVVYTPRDGGRRIISVRRANSREVRIHERAISDTNT